MSAVILALIVVEPGVVIAKLVVPTLSIMV